MSSKIGIIVRRNPLYKVLWNKDDGLVAVQNEPYPPGQNVIKTNQEVGNWFRYECYKADNHEDELECGMIKKIAFSMEYAPAKPRDSYVYDDILQVEAILEKKGNYSNESYAEYYDAVLGKILCPYDKTLDTLTNSSSSFVKVIAIYREGHQRSYHWIGVRIQNENGVWRHIDNIPMELQQLVDNLFGPNIAKSSSRVPLNVAPKHDPKAAMIERRQAVIQAVAPNIGRLKETYDEFNSLFVEKFRKYPIPNEIRERVDSEMYPVNNDCFIPKNTSLDKVHNIKTELMRKEIVIRSAMEEIRMEEIKITTENVVQRKEAKIEVAPINARPVIETSEYESPAMKIRRQAVIEAVAKNIGRLQQTYDYFNRLVDEKSRIQPISNELKERVNNAMYLVIHDGIIPKNTDRQMVPEIKDDLKQRQIVLNDAIEEIKKIKAVNADKAEIEDEIPLDDNPGWDTGYKILYGKTLVRAKDPDEELRIKVAELVNRLQLAHNNYKRALSRNQNSKEPMIISYEMADRVTDATERFLNAGQLNFMSSYDLEQIRNDVLQGLEVVNKATDEINRGISQNPANRPADSIASNSVQLDAAPMGIIPADVLHANMNEQEVTPHDPKTIHYREVEFVIGRYMDCDAELTMHYKVKWRNYENPHDNTPWHPMYSWEKRDDLIRINKNHKRMLDDFDKKFCKPHEVTPLRNSPKIIQRAGPPGEQVKPAPGWTPPKLLLCSLHLFDTDTRKTFDERTKCDTCHEDIEQRKKEIEQNIKHIEENMKKEQEIHNDLIWKIKKLAVSMNGLQWDDKPESEKQSIKQQERALRDELQLKAEVIIKLTNIKKNHEKIKGEISSVRLYDNVLQYYTEQETKLWNRRHSEVRWFYSGNHTLHLLNEDAHRRREKRRFPYRSVPRSMKKYALDYFLMGANLDAIERRFALLPEPTLDEISKAFDEYIEENKLKYPGLVKLFSKEDSDRVQKLAQKLEYLKPKRYDDENLDDGDLEDGDIPYSDDSGENLFKNLDVAVVPLKKVLFNAKIRNVLQPPPLRRILMEPKFPTNSVNEFRKKYNMPGQMEVTEKSKTRRGKTSEAKKKIKRLEDRRDRNTDPQKVADDEWRGQFAKKVLLISIEGTKVLFNRSDFNRCSTLEGLDRFQSKELPKRENSNLPSEDPEDYGRGRYSEAFYRMGVPFTEDVLLLVRNFFEWRATFQDTNLYIPEFMLPYIEIIIEIFRFYDYFNLKD